MQFPLTVVGVIGTGHGVRHVLEKSIQGFEDGSVRNRQHPGAKGAVARVVAWIASVENFIDVLFVRLPGARLIPCARICKRARRR